MKQFQLQFGGIHNIAVLGGLMVAQCTLGDPGYKGCPPFFSFWLLFVLFVLFCSLFFLSSFKSQLLNDVPAAVAGDGTQNPVEKVYRIYFDKRLSELRTKYKQ